MEFKGTQGPWKIIHGGFRHDDGFSIGSDNASASCVKVTCECWPCTIIDQEHRDELLANARLIAAAPDLLSACLGALRIQELWYPVASDDDEECAALNSMRKKFESAIAKALGES